MYTRSENDPALQEPESDSGLTNTINSEGSGSTAGDRTINTSVLVNLDQTLVGNL